MPLQSVFVNFIDRKIPRIGRNHCFLASSCVFCVVNSTTYLNNGTVLLLTGIRYKSEFSGDDQGRGRHSRHPSGLSGKQLGLWYAARGKKNKEKRDIKQVSYVGSCFAHLK